MVEPLLVAVLLMIGKMMLVVLMMVLMVLLMMLLLFLGHAELGEQLITLLAVVLHFLDGAAQAVVLRAQAPDFAGHHLHKLRQEAQFLLHLPHHPPRHRRVAVFVFIPSPLAFAFVLFVFVLYTFVRPVVVFAFAIAFALSLMVARRFHSFALQSLRAVVALIVVAERQVEVVSTAVVVPACHVSIGHSAQW